MSEDNEEQEPAAILPKKVEVLAMRVKKLEAAASDRQHSKSRNNGWATFLAVLTGIFLYRLFRYFSG